MRFTVTELKNELKEMEEKGYGSYTMFVPAESGYSGASIVDGYDVEIERKRITLYSDDM